jgi:septum site-determining protein MinD
MTRYSESKETKVISIVSGKGGTGKTLFTAMIGRALAREGLKVLIIDFDIFVRGLTILLSDYLQKGLQTEKGITISDLLLRKTHVEKMSPDELSERLAIFRFFECDVIPAVSTISEPLDYEQQDSSLHFSRSVISSVLSAVRNKYDIILIDNRASIDSLVLGTCYHSDIVVSVAEDDDLCLQTNSNLVEHLKRRQDMPARSRIYTIINKGRRITTYEDLKKEIRRLPSFDYVGVIPFDIEVMENFGEDHLRVRAWSKIYETLYFRAIIDVWNEIAKRENIGRIPAERYTFPPTIFMSKTGGRFSLKERMLRMYSLMLIFLGFLLIFYERILSTGLSLYETLSLVVIGLGLLMLVLTTTGFKRWLLGG